jgi:hypothetical protein
MKLAHARTIVPSLFLCLLFSLLGSDAHAQYPGYWQQHVSYTMDIDMDAPQHQYAGHQKVVYTNNSPDTLNNIYYHLYFNAFQPGSMMDTRSRNLPDPDGRVRDRILHLDESEIGYQKVHSLTQNGQPLSFEVQNTVLEAKLAEPLLPGESATFEMKYDAQVPLQIRRSGRDNREGIDFSMTQWYPKIAEYTHEGWQTHPYVAREYMGVYGEFDVTISIDSSYVLGGTGTLQNPQEVGYGYEDPSKPLKRPNSDKLTWHFYAEKVHTFAWAADPDYRHKKYKTKYGTDIHLLWDRNSGSKYWEDVLGPKTVAAVEYMSDHVGRYPYPQFSVIQGGDGGMEYPMTTLITGNRSERSLVGVMTHEMIHMWFYGILGNNESFYPWMDEGFTSYWTNKTTQHLYGGSGNPHLGSMRGYLALKYYGLEQPSITHADRFETNFAYGVSSYSKGAAFLHQLSYVVGEDNLARSMKRYFNTWQFKHPTPTDFKRVVEKESGLVLDWYFNFWLHSTDEIDYAIEDVERDANTVTVDLSRIGVATMPLDVQVTYTDGTKELHYIPLGIMRGEKPTEPEYGNRINHADWPWTHPSYSFSFEPEGEIASIQIDPSDRLADVNRLNNWEKFPLRTHTFKAPRADWNTYQVGWRPALWYGEKAGVRLGLTSQGTYLFGNNRMKFDFFLTSGELDDYSTSKTDVDYRFEYRRKLDQWGKETYMNLGLNRYYGIFQEYLELEKHLGKYGIISNTRQVLTFRAFHHVKTADRQVASLNRGWSSGDVYGLRFTYELGNPSRSGIRLNLTAATHRDLFSASYSELIANKTFEWTSAFNTRFGLAVGMGAQQLPKQYEFTMAGPNNVTTWENETFTSFYNISNSLSQDLHLLPNGGGGFVGYGLSGIGSPDRGGNQYFGLTIWNTVRPFKRQPLELELFSGLGKSWNGYFASDFPGLGNADSDPLLASIGAGIQYDISQWRKLRKWTAQSDFLNDLNLSLRMPFFMNDLQGHDDWQPRFVIGITESF